MLPIGNRRLFEHQIAELKTAFAGDDIYLSLPENFVVSNADKIYLGKMDIEIVQVPEGLSLGESVLYVINSIGIYDQTLRILHGDTLIQGFPTEADVIGVANTQYDYLWEVEEITRTDELVWCGYFSFSDIKQLVKCLTAARGHFADAIRKYSQNVSQVRQLVGRWLDLGHINTYFKSREIISTARSFNDLRIVNGIVSKSSAQRQKMAAEAHWFANIPYPLKRYTPQLLVVHGEANACTGYAIEYLCLPALNELFVHGRMPVFFWSKIFRLCESFFADCRRLASIDESISNDVTADFRQLVSDKTWSRLENHFGDSSQQALDQPTKLNGKTLPSLRHIVQTCISRTLESAPVLGIAHGDFCLSNILFDSRSEGLKVIDPRGLTQKGVLSIHGDLKYDAAKLQHSIIGLYDFIIAGSYSVRMNSLLDFEFEIYVDDQVREVQEVFKQRSFLGGLTSKDLMPLTILLFISMLPLHADQPLRQQAFLSNALRLFSEYLHQ